MRAQNRDLARRCAQAIAILLITLAAGSGFAQPKTPVALAPSAAAVPASTNVATPTTPPPPSQPPEFDLNGAERSIKTLGGAAAATEHGEALDTLHQQAAAIQARVGAADASLDGQIGAVDAKLKALGPVARPADRERERPALREERRKLRQERLALERREKATRIVYVDAEQTAVRLADQRRTLFNQHWLQRTDSPLSPELWAALGENLPQDAERLQSLVREAQKSFLRAPEPRTGWVLAGAAAFALLLTWPARRWLDAFGRRRAADDAPSSNLRRSGFALWMIVVDTATVLVAAVAVKLAAKWTGALSSRADAMAHALVVVAVWTAFFMALGRSVLSVERPSWRMPRLSDATARRFRPYVVIAAFVSGAGILVMRLNSVIGASLSATVAADFVVALLDVAVAAAALVALGRGREPPTDAAGPSSPANAPGVAAEAEARSPAWTLIALAATLAILATVGAALFGYTALAARIATQMFWISVLAVAVYVLSEFVDDATQTLLARDGWLGRALFMMFGLRASTVDQVAVLSSALLRLLIWAGALMLVLSPFGVGGAVVGRFNGLDQGLHIGQVTISPTAIIGGVVSLAIGMTIVRAVRRWFDTRYLPATDWDPGVQNSVSTGLSYLGITLAVLWALASAGLGLQRVALIASALSVGIGFGLQQVVQNFVSGLILLLERPVKVGDLVVVGGVEGDIRHIRVRATEIQTADRSTLLVPNSELITKVVQNKSLGDPLGRVQLQLALADPTSVRPARDLILKACVDNAAILHEPAPKVFIDGVNNGAVNLNCFAYVEGPRAAYAARSELYFEVLEQMREAKIALAGATQTLTLDPGADFGRFLAGAPAAETDATSPTPTGASAAASTAEPRDRT